MTFEEYMRERVRRPEYGTAPAGLISEYAAIVKKMEQAYREGAALTSDTMLALIKQANMLSDEISKYLPST